MIADTNFLLRALDPDDRDHGLRARRKLGEYRGRDGRVTVLSATVIEVAYVLASKAAGYGYGPDEVRETVDLILEEPALEVEAVDALRMAAELHQRSGTDFHDCFLTAVALASGDSVLSFDGDLERLGVGFKP